ncbi:MAG: RNA polymerase sigma factor, partial [Proteobacteria bacterium]|nr:RNA polymerase sigma factor [Pseudomonadota bacterium]
KHRFPVLESRPTEPEGPGVNRESERTELMEHNRNPTEYAELRSRLELAVRRVCPPWLANHAEDIVQAAVIKILRRKGEGIGELKSSYLYKVAHSVMVDEIRRLRRRKEVGMEDNFAAEVDRQQLGPEAQAAGRELGEGILSCLGRLSTDRRRAVTLYLQGHTTPESARLLDWSPKRTENLIYRGLGELRKCLKSKGLKP